MRAVALSPRQSAGEQRSCSKAVVVATIIVLGRRVVDPVAPDPKRPLDGVGATLSAVGMFFLVLGILQAGVDNTLMVVFLALGVACLTGFMFFIRSRERAGKEPLLSIELFRNRTSKLGLVTQNLQWLLLMGVSFVVSVFLQTERHYSAIKTGVIFTAATLGVLVSSLAAERMTKRRLQKRLIAAGVSNLGSSFGTAIAGTILVSNLSRNGTYVAAMLVLVVVAFAGLAIATRLPANRLPSADPNAAPPVRTSAPLDGAV